jgi:hypothetical protein
MVDLNTVSIESKDGLLDYLTLLKDSRKKRGIRHSQISILAVAICAYNGPRNSDKKRGVL